MRAAEASNLHTETAQAEYLTSLGWEVEPVPIETKTIQLPQKFSPTYESYNALQLQQGYDLTDYRGKEVNRVTFRITNHPSGEKVVADLLICDGKLIGGDVQSPTLNGFMEGLAFPKTEKQTVSVQPEGVTASV